MKKIILGLLITLSFAQRGGGDSDSSDHSYDHSSDNHYEEE